MNSICRSMKLGLILLDVKLVQRSVTINNHKHLTLIYSSKNYCNMTSENDQTFTGTTDRYFGITINSEGKNLSSDEFKAALKDSLVKWSEEKRRAIWFKVHLKQAHWVPILAENDFKFHHAKNNFVMMYRWLPKDEGDNVPCYAHTNVGVGGLVVNEKNQLLVVSEKYFDRHLWKLPGGFVDPGEYLIDAVIREVQEETNIKTEFVSLLTLRHSHNRQFDCSDFYIVLALKPLTYEITKCEREIMDAKWMDFDEFLNDPDVFSLNKFFLRKYLQL